ncbi:MAG: protein kinase [Deltaproteobacteria bacterium]|nr:protein kinase [Deltaproteobacteria bacterium]
MVEPTLGKYSVDRRLGVGGMAEVFLCRRRGIGGFDKQVVIKRIRPDITHDPAFLGMFLDEARVAANLSHPNIVQIFEIDELDGVPYIAMEYVHGPTLAHLLRLRPTARPPRYGEFAQLGAGVAAGLHYAHNARDASGAPLGLVHRDISPHNIIISLDGTAKVFDFGVAKARGNRALTNVGLIKGKISYMAPEQMLGRPVDHRADIYALGVCLYEATVGQRPFNAATEGELFAARIAGTFPRPREVRPDYPPELEEILLAAMAPEPADRPSGAELQRALTGFASSRSSAAAQDLADWIGELCSDEEASDLAGDAYAEAIVTPTPGRGGAERSSRMWSIAAAQTPTRRRRPLRSIAIGGAGLVGVAAVALYLLTQGGAHGAAPARIAPAAAALAPVAASPADQVRVYLEEAARLADAHRWQAASDMLARARKHPIDDAALDVAMTTLGDRIDLGQLRERARHALDARDHAGALAAVDALLDRAPDDPDGQRLLIEVGALQPAAAAPSAEVGTLTVAAAPGATVYVDGQLIAHGSFTRRTEARGPHEVVVRQAHLAPVHRTITIHANRETRVALLPGAPDTAAVAVAAVAPPPDAPPLVASIAPPDAAPPPPDAAMPLAPTAALAPPPPDAGAPAPTDAIAAPARSMKELAKVMSVIEGEAVTRGLAPASIHGVSGGLVEEAFASFAPGQLIEVHPSAIYYTIVRAARAGRGAGAIAAELRAAYGRGQL